MILLAHRYASLTDLPASYAQLFERRSADLQFDQTLAWYDTLWRHASDPGESLELLGIESPDGTALALLPLRRQPLRFAAPRRVTGLASYYASLFGPVGDLQSAAGEQLLERLCAALRTELHGWDSLELQPLAAEVEVRLRRAMQAQGIATHSYFRFGNWYLEVGGRGFAEYFKALPSQLRNTVTRREKKLRAAGNMSLEILRSVADVERGLRAYEEIYASSWKRPEPYPQFVPSMARAMAARGWLRLGVVSLDSKPLAAQLWFVKDGVASIFKLAYDERFKEFSAGSILTTALMRYVIDEDKVAVVDYLTGDDAYKRDWMSHRRERVGLMAFNPRTLRGRALAAQERLSAWVKQRLKAARRQSSQS